MDRIALSNAAFEGDNNAYLFADGRETTLVDPGDWMATTRKQLERGLGDRGLGFADVDRILLTHWHADHTGLAGAIQAESGASVHVHEADAPLVAGDPDAWGEMEATQERYFEEWGVPESGRELLWDVLMDSGTVPTAPAVTPFADGDSFTVDGEALTVVHAPGHAAGLCLFEVGGEILSGDALLPEYTPNVGGADVRVDDALGQYLRALDSIAAAGYRRAWPGHREPIEDPAARAEEIVRHHEERAWRVLDALRRRGPSDPWTVSADLFGDLDGIHVLHGPGEAYAHLDHLGGTGAVVRSGDEYRLADGIGAELDSRDDGRWPLER
jgi:glyoxylase-like metal-dependent hydrolase (beta-lactamase superfamily II)